VADFDAIIVGSGMSGGWVAKELCERGLKTLVLERGPDVSPSEDYSDMLDPWEKKHLDRVRRDEALAHYQRQKDVYVFYESTKHFWVRDSDQPYTTAPGADYEWYRGNHVGGRSLTWARMSFRFGDLDFNANLADGVGVDWPIRYADLEPWYDKVEDFVGVSGDIPDLPTLPKGRYLPPFEMNCAEEQLKSAIERRFSDRTLIVAPVANLKQAQSHHNELGRGDCQARNLCYRGCSFGAYFSSNSATLPAARNTGNLILKADAIVDSLVYDDATQRVTGVRVVDRVTQQRTTYTADMVFMNASAVATALILLNSKSERYPNGLANDSDQVGRNLMDHVAGAQVSAKVDGLNDKTVFGRRPAPGYIPRYVNYPEQTEPYKRGFAFQVYSERGSWSGNRPGVGEALKTANRTPGDWNVVLDAYAEVLPDPNNRVTISNSQTDKWGTPVPHFDCRMGPNEVALLEAASDHAVEILTTEGFSEVTRRPVQPTKPGNRIHEMGTARMGRDPASSVLNEWNQAWGISNLFITDGACMTSSAIVNPSITYMALSARAANHAADLKESGQL
jgi:choline dehydrogenase-like flavoprotein